MREDSLTLYGFADDDERALFELLQTANGVGPKLAQTILGVHPPREVRRAIATNDLTALIKVPGIGRKGAERIVLELRDRIGSIDGGSDASRSAAASPRSRRGAISSPTPWPASASRARSRPRRSTCSPASWPNRATRPTWRRCCAGRSTCSDGRDERRRRLRADVEPGRLDRGRRTIVSPLPAVDERDLEASLRPSG